MTAIAGALLAGAALAVLATGARGAGAETPPAAVAGDAGGSPAGSGPGKADGAVASADGKAEAPADGDAFPVPPPPITEGYYPCSTCHGVIEPNYTRRELQDEHTGIHLSHGPRERWCFDCHDAKNRDQLHLASGAPVPFTASYRLCGQCHGDKYRDWRVGVHGKRTGSWEGQKMYLLCPNCHDPHSPHFKPLKPLPPPTPPAAIH